MVNATAKYARVSPRKAGDVVGSCRPAAAQVPPILFSANGDSRPHARADVVCDRRLLQLHEIRQAVGADPQPN